MSAGPRAGAVAWAAGLVVAAAALHAAGHGALSPPPVLDPGRWPGWLATRDPIVAAFSILRLAALAGLWYVVAATAVGALLRLVGAAALVRLADRVTIGPVRRLLAGGVSLGLAASGLVGVAVPALAAQTPTTTSSTAPSSIADPPVTLTMHRLEPAEVVRPAVVTPLPRLAPGATVKDVAPGATVKDVAAAALDRWTVKPGECFWTIAERVLADHAGRAPTDAEIVPYWRRLIDANRLELAQRDNPDLIFPGQTFTVPTP